MTVKKRVKTFTGCWTCRARKVKCDLRRPGCVRCEKGGLECGGYDIKLRWTKPIQFDKSGNIEVAPSLGANDSEEQLYQRRNIAFVHYKEEYTYYEDMDDELSALSSPPLSLISENRTWIIKKFGVFKGTERVKKKYVPRKKRKTNHIFLNAVEKERKRLLQNERSRSLSNEKTVSPKVSSVNREEFTKNLQKLFEFDMNYLLFPGNEWISNELKDDALLSASAIQGGPISSFSAFEDSHSINIAPQERFSGIESSQLDTSNDDLNKVYRLLFHSSSFNVPDPIGTDTRVVTPSKDKSDGIVPLNNTVELNAPGSAMPATVIEVVPSALPDTSIFNIPGNNDTLLNIPTTAVQVHGLTRFLLNYYLQNVADLMTVVVLPTNPWKTIYFPRALKALGDLSGIGYTSNSRNSLLNALLAVSCFNLQSKFEKNSPEMKFFLSLGIEFRSQASSFLKKCLGYTVNQERYKDILTAILSMNSIDVVWGTMADCQLHLTICEDFVERRMKKRPKISSKAKALHRIFSFLKLIQDSTSLDKVRPSEIVVPDSPHLAIDTFSCEDVQYSGEFRESLNAESGKINIEFVKRSTDSVMDSLESRANAPLFTNIASESYCYTKCIMKDNGFLSTDALYGLPNSLILLFSDCVRLARHKEYYRMHNLQIPFHFNRMCTEFEHRVLTWKSEWEFRVPGSDIFLSDTVEGVYHHTVSFHNGLIVYFMVTVKRIPYENVQTYVKNVLESLNRLGDLIEIEEVKIVPLIWQGFMAGCACTDQNLQLQFKDWAARLGKSGMGSYWGARQIMFEVWRRRFSGESNDNWFAVYKDWEMNLMLS